MADLTVIALAEYDDGETESFATSVHGADVTRGEFETEIGESLIEAGEMMLEHSIDTVDEFRDWAHEEVGDAGTITWTSGGDVDNIPEGEKYCYTAYNEPWTDVTLPDGWVMEDSESGGCNFRKEANFNDEPMTVTEFQDWAYGTDHAVVPVAEEEAEEYWWLDGNADAYTHFPERWTARTDDYLPDVWTGRTEFDGGDAEAVMFYREGEDTTTIDPEEWYVGGLVFGDSGIAEQTEVEAEIDDYYYYFSQEDNIPIAITEQVSGGYGERSEAELIDALERNS